MTHRTATDKRRAVYLLGAIAVLAIIGLATMGNGRAACTASADICAYSLR